MLMVIFIVLCILSQKKRMDHNCNYPMLHSSTAFPSAPPPDDDEESILPEPKADYAFLTEFIECERCKRVVRTHDKAQSAFVVFPGERKKYHLKCWMKEQNKPTPSRVPTTVLHLPPFRTQLRDTLFKGMRKKMVSYEDEDGVIRDPALIERVMNHYGLNAKSGTKKSKDILSNLLLLGAKRSTTSLAADITEIRASDFSRTDPEKLPLPIGWKAGIHGMAFPPLLLAKIDRVDDLSEYLKNEVPFLPEKGIDNAWLTSFMAVVLHHEEEQKHPFTWRNLKRAQLQQWVDAKLPLHRLLICLSMTIQDAVMNTHLPTTEIIKRIDPSTYKMLGGDVTFLLETMQFRLQKHSNDKWTKLSLMNEFPDVFN